MPELFPPDRRRSLRSQSLDLLRFPLAVIVASIHVIATRAYYIEGHYVRFSDMEGARMFYRFFDAYLRAQSVPIYFFIAGYVFFLGIKLTIDTYGHKLHNRTKSLLIPYVSWNILAVVIALIAFLPEMRDILPVVRNIHLDWSLPNILETFWNSWYGIFTTGKPMPPGSEIYPQDYPLWFVRDLMILAVSAPLIYFCLKKTRWYVVGFLGLAWIALSPFKLGHFSQLLTGFFFFSWGAYMSYHGKDMIAEFRKFFSICTICYILISTSLWLGTSIPPSIYALLKSVNVVAGMVMAYGIAAKLIESRRVKISRFLAASSFFVYAGHGIFVAYINMLFFQWLRPWNMWGVTAVYLLTLIVTIVGLLLIFKLCGRFAPMIQQIFAGRKYN